MNDDDNTLDPYETMRVAAACFCSVTTVRKVYAGRAVKLATYMRVRAGAEKIGMRLPTRFSHLAQDAYGEA